MNAPLEITGDELTGMRLASRSGTHPLEWLSERRGIAPRQAAQCLASRLGVMFLDSAALTAWQACLDRFPLVLAQRWQCAVLIPHTSQDQPPLPSQHLVCLVSNPFDDDLLLQVQHRAAAPCRLGIATPDDIRAFLHQREEATSALHMVSRDAETGRSRAELEVLSFASSSEAGSAASRLVNSTLFDAQRAGASDVHFESTRTGFAVRYRIDGVLDQAAEFTGVELAEQVVSRIKVLAGLDIAEHRIPQDGSFRVEVRDREIDLRVSIMPSTHGEDVVVRILDKQAIVEAAGRLTLDALGFDHETLHSLRRLLDEPYGMVLVTGPTGAGKTTTLYAALAEIHTGRDKVITIEDPVEYQLAGMLQIPVNEKKGLTFARGLRSILRHDPDIIMVGEIRDRETAEIAVQSALTGHLVLSTVHANSVFDVFGRFAHMGLDLYALASAVNGVWAQRLVRVNCPSCRQDHAPDPSMMQRLSLTHEDVAGFHFQRGMGCGECRGTGYRGRRAIAEVLRLDAEIRERVIARQPIREIKALAQSNLGMRSIAHAGLKLVREGHTTLEEIRRVVSAG